MSLYIHNISSGFFSLSQRQSTGRTFENNPVAAEKFLSEEVRFFTDS
jgi:hypothetical protein